MSAVPYTMLIQAGPGIFEHQIVYQPQIYQMAPHQPITTFARESEFEYIATSNLFYTLDCYREMSDQTKPHRTDRCMVCKGNCYEVMRGLYDENLPIQLTTIRNTPAHSQLAIVAGNRRNYEIPYNTTMVVCEPFAQLFRCTANTAARMHALIENDKYNFNRNRAQMMAAQAQVKKIREGNAADENVALTNRIIHWYVGNELGKGFDLQFEWIPDNVFRWQLVRMTNVSM